jgi:hypothetical protein
MTVGIAAAIMSNKARFHARLLTVIALTVLFLACHGKGRVRSRLDAADRTCLLTEARELHARYSGTDVPRSAWPPGIAALEPEAVSVDRYGVRVCTSTIFVESAGVFIRMDPSFDPPTRGDPKYEQLYPDFYWYYSPG